MLTAPISGITGHDPAQRISVAAARRLALILNHADAIGLPLPETVSMGANERLRLDVPSLEDVTAWCEALRADGQHAQISSHRAHDHDGLTHSVAGDFLDAQIAVVYASDDIVLVPLLNNETLISGGAA